MQKVPIYTNEILIYIIMVQVRQGCVQNIKLLNMTQQNILFKNLIIFENRANVGID